MMLGKASNQQSQSVVDECAIDIIAGDTDLIKNDIVELSNWVGTAASICVCKPVRGKINAMATKYQRRPRELDGVEMLSTLLLEV